ncbi:MAG: MinD-like protein [Candidatus Accumulibacter sp.]|nr:MinD-like protein [Accumulibacter sp.]
MAEYRGDQAAGLRRLFGREQSRIVTFVAGSVGVGKSISVANLAAALARQGKEVLVLDEGTDENVASLFGSVARYDLLHVINREKHLSEVLLPVAPGVRILPAARAVKKLGKLSIGQRETLLESLSAMDHPADVILVDASPDHPLGFSPLGLAAHETVIVVSATGASITEAYSLIKKVSLGYARKHFRILVNKVRAADEAEAIHANIAQVTRSRGLARLDYAGFVPLDEHLRQAGRLCQPVLGLFPDAPSAKAYRQLASDLLLWPGPDNEAGGLEHFVQQLIHLSQRIEPIAIHAG